MSNVMPGVMFGILKESEPIGTDIVDRNATKRPNIKEHSNA
jgi:hypothetical protein